MYSIFRDVLDNIIKFSIQNKLIIGLMMLIWIIWGVWSASQLAIDAQPDITNNQVQIITQCPSLAGQEVEQLVTFPVEQSIVNLPYLTEIRSISRFGLSVVTVVFEDNVDIYFARQLVNERLQEAQQQIPAGAGRPEMAPVSTGLGEVYQYILHPKKGSEHKYTATDLRTMQDWIVARQLYGTAGIAEVNSFGGLLKQYEVAINPDRLLATGINIIEVFTALEQNNENTGGAYIDKKPNAYFIRGVGLATSLEDVGNIVVKKTSAAPVLIKDIAEVRFGHATRYGAMTYKGEVDAVGGIVMMLKGENSAKVVSRIKEKLPLIQQSLPEDIVIEAYLDRTDLVGRAMNTVKTNLIEGALIVIFVLILFLGNLRAGLIVASAIPLSMLFALAMMHLFGVSANLMSLGAIDFGLIVDGSLIVVEATMHHLGLRKSMHKLSQSEMDEEVFESARKIRKSAAFGEIIILIVYIPILSLTGIEGKMFTPMAKTVGFAILGALILSFTYIPMMSALCLSKENHAKRNFSDRMMDWLQRGYEPILRRAVRAKTWVLGLAIVLLTVSIGLFSRMGSEFLPKLGEGDFAFHCILPQGTSLSQSIETSMQASRVIQAFDEVKMVVGKTGTAEVPTDPMPPEATDLMIILKPQKEWKNKRSYDELANDMMEELQDIPGVFFEASQPIQLRFNELMTGIRQDVAVKLFGENLDSLLSYAEKAHAIIREVPGVSAAQIERVSGLPQINIEYNRARMANYGLNIQEVNAVVNMAFAGKAAGNIYENERRFELVVRLDTVNRNSIADVRSLLIPLDNGEQIFLSQIADVDYQMGPAQISREDGRRRIFVGFNVVGRDISSVVHEIQEKLGQEISLPTGYFFTYGGQFENLQEATQRLLIAVPISLALIFLLLYFTFSSMRDAALVFAAIPMSAIGGIFALLMRSMPFSISAGIGFIALFGVAVLNGIVLIATFKRLENEGWSDPILRIIEGTKMRLRPVLMTASVASLGFLPMALSTGAGAEVQKPLATVVIGGLVSATALTLFVLPILYLLMQQRKPRKLVVKALVMLIFMTLNINPIITQAQQKTLTVEEAIAAATQNNLLLKSKSMGIRAAESRTRTAHELPKTNVNFQYGQNEGFERNDGIQISQTIPFPTLFGAKKDLAQAKVQEAHRVEKVSINDLRQQVRNSYYQLEYLLQQQKILHRLDSVYADFIRVAALRYRTGDTRKIDVGTATVKRGELALMIQENLVAIKINSAELSNLMQSDEAFELPEVDNYVPLIWNQHSDLTLLQDQPTLQLLQQQVNVVEHSKRVERAQGLPDFTLGYNNVSLIGNHIRNGIEQFYGRSQRFSYVDVGIAIPLTFGATKARIRALDFDKQAVQQQYDWQAQLMTTYWNNLLQTYQQDYAQYTYYRSQAVPNTEEIVRVAQLGYRTGDIAYLEYLFALESATNVQLSYLKSILKVNQTVTQLYTLINK